MHLISLKARHRWPGPKIALMLMAIFSTVLISAASAQETMRYTGIARMTVQLTDAFGQAVGVQTYQTAVEGLVSYPLPGETNPFRLQIQSTPLVNAPGEFSISSSFPGEDSTFQYWTYQFQDQAFFSGLLAQDHAEEAIDSNLITIPAEIAPNLTQPFSLPMAENTEITGSLSEETLEINIVGNTADFAHPFTIEGTLSPAR